LGIPYLYCTNLISKTYINLPGSTLSKIPQVPSNTEPAQYIRCAVAEAVIAQTLARKVFLDFYLPESSRAELSALIRALAWLREEHPRQATIARCQIATACNEHSGKGQIPTLAAEEVCTILNPWISDNTARERLAGDLTNLFREAMDLWQNLQRAEEPATTVVDVGDANWLEEEDARSEYNKVAVGEEHRPQGTTSGLLGPLAVLFPQIWIGSQLVYHGFALFHTQSAVIAASLERSQRNSRNTNTNRRRMSESEKRDSAHQRKSSGDGTQRSSLGAPSDLSYSERVNSRPQRTRTDPAASVSSTKSQRTGSGTRGQ